VVSDQLLLADPVLDDVLDRDRLEIVRPGEREQLGHPGHPPVLVHHLADHPDGLEPRQAREIHGGLRVPGPAQDAAGHRPEREDVAGARQVVRPRGRIQEGLNRHGAVVGRGSRRDAAAGIHGDRERRPHRGRIVRDHHRDLERVEPVTRHRHADQAAAVLGHEVHGLGRDLVGGHHQVALVFPVLVVDHHQDPAGADLLDGGLDRHELAAHASPRARN
jgi:hypothetical protein